MTYWCYYYWQYE